MKTTFKLFVMLLSVITFAQTNVKGTITDNSGQPLPGANIIIEGTTTGTSSDFDGKYIINTEKTPPFKLVITYTGFEKQTI
jgi:hypothetical protein